ncbi:hypothetical protein [Streptomyces sp. NPDC001635]
MANFLDDQTTSRRLAQLLADLDRRLQALERTSQASYTSINGGTLDIYDDEGNLKGSIGVQPDGTVALVPVNSTPPYTPTPPIVEPVLAGLVIGWDGQWDDSYETPSDFALVQVHVGTAEDFTPDLTTQIATITAPLGGTVTVQIEGYDPVWVRLVAANTAAVTGPPSAAVQGQPRQAVGQDLIDGIVTEVKLAENAVSAAKIALGAVGSTALADGAVLEDKLAKAAVTLGKIAEGAVTINALGGALSDSAAQRYVDTMGDPAAWAVTDKGTGATWDYLSGITDAPTSQHVGQAVGYNRLLGNIRIPYEPGVLYRVSARLRLTGPAGAADTFYVGVAGLAADGATLVNRDGANSPSGHYYVAATAKPITTGDGWVQVIGFLNGRAPAGTSGSAGPNNDPRTAGVVHADVRYIAPYVWLNYSGLGGTSSTVMQVDVVTLEALKTGVVDSVNLVAGSVTTAALATDSVTAGKIAADAISARELKAGSVTASELAAGSVTAQAVAAGSITADKLTIVGSPNVLPDPSFEGAGGAAIAAKQPYLTQDKTFGNGSPSSLKLDATASAATYRAAELTLLPVTPGDQVYIATDYYPSTDWAGAEINMQIRWEKADGTIIDYGRLSNTAPARGAWARFAGTVTAPADAVQGRVRVESGNATAGSVSWDNAAVRPVVPGVQIADGAITAPKILAGAITTDKLVALAVTAEKIAALAITTDKLAALSITADKMAVNSVTATAIAVGAVDATHIKARAITTDKLVIGDPSNILLDPDFTQNSNAWGWNSNVVRTASSDSSVPTGAPAQWVAKVTPQTTLNADFGWRHTATATGGMAVTPGETYYVEAWVVASSTCNANLRFFLTTWDAAGGNTSWPSTANVSPSATRTWTKISGQITIPAGKYLAAFGIGPVATTPTTAAGFWCITNIKMRKAVDSALVVAGSITAEKLDADAINGKTITGATIRAVRSDGSVAAIMAPDLGDGNAGFGTTHPTNGTSARLEAGQLSFLGPGLAPDTPAFVAGDANNGVLELGSGQRAVNHTQARMLLASGDSDLAESVNPGGAPYIWIGWDGGSVPATADMLVMVAGVLMPRNVAWGTVTITVTTANTPASITVTGLTLLGNTFRGWATPQSNPAGITGMGVSNITRSSAVVWANRSSPGTVTLAYQIAGVL